MKHLTETRNQRNTTLLGISTAVLFVFGIIYCSGIDQDLLQASLTFPFFYHAFPPAKKRKSE